MRTNSLWDDNPVLASEWHPIKNDELTPDKVSSGSGLRVWWKCSRGHEWEAAINNRSKGSGCPYCSGHKVWPGFNDLASTHRELAMEWHPTKNLPTVPQQISIGSVTKVWWLGKCGHEWLSSPNNRSKGYGCPFCAGKAVLEGYNDLNTVAPHLAEEWHPSKNGELRPEMVTAGSVKKVWWLGKCGHEWQSTINNRWNGHGCPICVQKNSTSFPEQAIYYFIKRQFPDAISRYRPSTLKKMEFDVYIPLLSTAIEYDGIAWHSSDASRAREMKKYQSCLEMGIRLIRIKEGEPNTLSDECHYCIPIKPAPTYNDIDLAIDKLFAVLGLDNHINVDTAKNVALIKSEYITNIESGSLATIYPQLAAQWHPQKNGQLRPEMFSPFAHDKVWWIGECGHEWSAAIASRSAGTRCPYCTNHKLLKGFNDLGTKEHKLASEWHPTKNGNTTPSDMICTSNQTVWWLGKCGHEWEASIYARSKGSGCPYCNGRKVDARINSLAKNYPEVALEWHPTKNGNVTAEMVTARSSKKVWWLCQAGHEWQATIQNRSRDHGCPYCAKIQVGKNDLYTIAPTLAAEWHPINNGVLTPRDVGRGTKKLIWWQGKCGHEWQSAIRSRIKGVGCPYCSGRKKKSE